MNCKQLAIFLIILSSLSVALCLSNPSAVYCKEQGNDYITELDIFNNEISYCLVGDEKID